MFLTLRVPDDCFDGCGPPVDRQPWVAEHVRPPEDRVERRPKLVRERREEFILDAPGLFRIGSRNPRLIRLALRRRKQCGIFERRRRARGDGFYQSNVGFTEHASCRAPERNRPQQLSVTQQGANHAAARPKAFEDRLDFALPQVSEHSLGHRIVDNCPRLAQHLGIERALRADVELLRDFANQRFAFGRDVSVGDAFEVSVVSDSDDAVVADDNGDAAGKVVGKVLERRNQVRHRNVGEKCQALRRLLAIGDIDRHAPHSDRLIVVVANDRRTRQHPDGPTILGDPPEFVLAGFAVFKHLRCNPRGLLTIFRVHEFQPEIRLRRPLDWRIANELLDIRADVVDSLLRRVGPAPGLPHNARDAIDDVLQACSLVPYLGVASRLFVGAFT